MIEIEMAMKPDALSSTVKKAAAFFKSKKTAEISREMFQFLLNPLKENLYNFILKALDFCEDADDVYQDTVLRAFKYKNTYDENRSFKTWLFTIAHNEIKRYFNKTRKAPDTLARAENITIDHDTGDKTLVRDIYEIAGQLTPNRRKVFFLFYDQRFSIMEISEITGLKQGNIKFILNQAREKIKQKLGFKGGQNDGQNK
jgi:RNA polymerase sigma-70 factor (ECF subfamily)